MVRILLGAHKPNFTLGKGKVVDTAILMGEVSLAVGFLVFISRSLLERVQELGLFSRQED